MAYTEKERQRVMVATLVYRLEGDIWVLPGSRLTDMLNIKAKDFIPLTDATIYDPLEDRVLYKKDYVAVQRDSIVMIFPV